MTKNGKKFRKSKLKKMKELNSEKWEKIVKNRQRRASLKNKIKRKKKDEKYRGKKKKRIEKKTDR